MLRNFFAVVIQNRFLSVGSFKENLDKTRREGNAQEFGKLMERVKSLKKFCHSNEGAKFIRDLFTQAQIVLNARGAPGDFLSFVGMISYELATDIPLAKLRL